MRRALIVVLTAVLGAAFLWGQIEQVRQTEKLWETAQTLAWQVNAVAQASRENDADLVRRIAFVNRRVNELAEMSRVNDADHDQALDWATSRIAALEDPNYAGVLRAYDNTVTVMIGDL